MNADFYISLQNTVRLGSRKSWSSSTRPSVTVLIPGNGLYPDWAVRPANAALDTPRHEVALDTSSANDAPILMMSLEFMPNGGPPYGIFIDPRLGSSREPQSAAAANGSRSPCVSTQSLSVYSVVAFCHMLHIAREQEHASQKAPR